MWKYFNRIVKIIRTFFATRDSLEVQSVFIEFNERLPCEMGCFPSGVLKSTSVSQQVQNNIREQIEQFQTEFKFQKKKIIRNNQKYETALFVHDSHVHHCVLTSQEVLSSYLLFTMNIFSF